ncbi:MAG: branched-chain amino acid ABC transporter permease [Thermodesulfobacteriota bacterium]
MPSKPKRWERLPWLGVTALLMVMPLVLGKGYYLNVMNFIGIYSIVAVGLCLLVGYGGQLSISHSAFFAIGAYGSAVLCVRLRLDPLITIVLSQMISALAAWGIGAVVLRLKGHYLAIATLSFTVIMETLIKEMPRVTGGLNGLAGIPSISAGPFVIDSDWQFYYLLWPVALLLLLFALNLVDSRMGRVFRAIREGEDVARQFGVDVRKYKIKLFVLSSVYASLAGSLYAHFVSFISPSAGSIMFAIEMILIIALGGYTLIWGAMLGVFALTLLNEYLAIFAEFKRMIYGSVLIVIIMFFPNGLFLGMRDLLRTLIRAFRTRKGNHASAQSCQ